MNPADTNPADTGNRTKVHRTQLTCPHHQISRTVSLGDSQDCTKLSNSHAILRTGGFDTSDYTQYNPKTNVSNTLPTLNYGNQQ